MFILKHKLGNQNKVADALSMRTLLVTTMENIVVGFESINGIYEDDTDFTHVVR